NMQGFAPMSEVVRSSLEVIEKRFKQKGLVAGVPTGFKMLDQYTTGLQAGDLIIVAGRPSMGKTAFALNMATNAALEHGVCAAVFSLEMSKEQLGLRLLSSEARVSGSKIRSGFLSYNQDFPALTAAADRLLNAPIYIDDTPAISVLEMRAKARRLKQEKNLGLILVDYLQLMRGRTGGHDSREQEISDISRSLKALAKELSVPVVALSQLNRKVEDRPGDKRPMLSDLRESGAIEQDADVIMFIFRKKVYKKKDEPEAPDDNLAEVIIGKQRNGPTGTVKLVFLDDLTKFEDLAYEDGLDQG
ncbi:MAG: replicative DNA helicase, partial [Desulfarculus sp.]|nr:replicative DNA helicase [Desulfarculus sp.]